MSQQAHRGGGGATWQVTSLLSKANRHRESCALCPWQWTQRLDPDNAVGNAISSPQVTAT